VSDPHHRPASTPVGVEEARARMLAEVAPLGSEPTRVGPEALGRVLARAVSARRDQPPFDASAMDGYAVRPADLHAGEATLTVVGESSAGRRWTQPLQPGQAVRIFTGAPVPEAAVVVIQEDVTREGDRVRIGPRRGESDHVRRRGADFAAGAALLTAGLRLDPWRLSLAAAAGCAEVEVARRPRLAILSTGEEIVSAGRHASPDQIGPDQIYDSGGPALSSRVAQWGGVAQTLAPARDDEAAIAAAVEAADAELIVTVGGASVGDHDLVKPALARLGLTILVPSIKMRPGKPTWFGRLDDGRLVLGLPGNPASALVSAELFLRPLLSAWQGADPALPMRAARLAAPLPPTGPREHWMRARLGFGADGTMTVAAFPDQDSSLVSVLALADALLRRPAAAAAATAGELVEVLSLERL